MRLKVDKPQNKSTKCISDTMRRSKHVNLRQDVYKETIPTDIMLKLMKTIDQEEILKAAGSSIMMMVENTYIIVPQFLLKS